MITKDADVLRDRRVLRGNRLRALRVLRGGVLRVLRGDRLPSRFLHALAVFVAGVVTLSGAGTPLADAVKAGQHDVVRALIQQKADVNAPEADGTTALHWAARADDLEMVQLLLRAGARADAANRNRITPLSLAALSGSRAVVEALVEAGAGVNTRLPQGQTALMMAARGGNAAVVESLLSRGAEVDARETALGETALIWAAAENHAAVIRTLVARGADVNGRSNAASFPRKEFGDGKSGRLTVLPTGRWAPIMYAARQNAALAVRALAESGADLDAVDPDGMTALLVAVINAHYETAALLLDLGASPDIGDSSGMTPLYSAVDINTFADTPGRPAPTPVGRMSTVDMVKDLLAHGANPNAALSAPILVRVHDRGDGTLGAGATALMRAAKKADLDMMRVLLEGGADPTSRTKAGTDALMFASGLGGAGRFAEFEDRQVTDADYLEAATLLLDRGANVNAASENGQTALHLAAGSRSEPYIRLLAARGARLDVKDKQGRTPLDVAAGVGGRGRGGAPPAARGEVAALLRQLAQSGRQIP
jgi:ankyrin repeat protein